MSNPEFPVAIQGVPGSFHAIAAERWFGEGVDLFPCESFSEVFAALRAKKAGAAVVAIENSIHGSINQVYDLLLENPFPIIGEVPERVHQNLIGVPGASTEDLTHVYSHPVALAQCSRFLDEHFPKIERIEHKDTAESVAYIKELGDPTRAAIAGYAAAELYGMPILQERIEDNTRNFTRFLIIQPEGVPPADADKSSLVVRTNHTPGDLFHALGAFYHAQINLAKLQSQPIVGEPWKYQFYIDVEAAGQQLLDALEELKAQDCTVTILGQYKKALREFED